MNRFFLTLCAALVALTSYAGGLLANTNQNASFLRNPARDAVIAIDGVYTNPAGTAFLPKGFHLSLSWQAAFQKRQITSNNALYQLGGSGNKKFFEGVSNAPIIPSFQAVYVINDKWSVSAQFAVGGGGGKCEFDEGLPMFEEMVGGTLTQAQASSYALSQTLTGEQYFYGFQVGGTYKILDKVSVFAGVRGVLANCSYTGAISNIKANDIDAGTYMNNLAQQASMAAQQYAALGMTAEALKYQEIAASAMQGAHLLGTDLNLDCSQSGFGVTPIIGVDVNLGKINLAAKYEFRTKINLENESNNSANVDAIMPTYANGQKVRSDIPALFTLGAQYSIIPSVRVAAGFHYYFDKDAKSTVKQVENKTYDKLINFGNNTWEITFGTEWDINDKWLVSAGVQRTQYGFDDKDMSDLSFNICSTALCIGGAYKFNERMKLNVGYMHSFYEDHKLTNSYGSNNIYTRKNDAVGVSFDISF